MNFQSITLRNFGPYFGACTIPLAPSRGGDRPICLIGAMNGSGKTSLLDGILLALYGSRAHCSTRAELSWKDFLLRARNRLALADQATELSLSFDYPSSAGTRLFRVQRSWRPIPSGVAEALKVFVTEPGKTEQLDPELSETWAERVEELIPLGVSNLFFFDGEQVRALAIADQTTPEVRAAIRSLLGLELADRLSRDLAIIGTRKQKEMVGGTQLKEAEEVEKKLARVEQERDQLRTRLRTVQGQLDVAERRLAKLKDQFLTSGGRFAADRQQIEKQLDHARDREEGARVRLRDLAAGALPLGMVAPLLARAVQRARAEHVAEGASARTRLLEERDQQVLDLLAGMEIEPPTLQNLARRLQEDRQAQQVGLDGEPYLYMSTAAQFAAKQLLQESLPEAEAAVRTWLGKVAEARADADRMQTRLSAAAAPEDLTAHLSQLNKETTNVANLTTSRDSLEEGLIALDAEHSKLTAELEKKLRVLTEHRKSQESSLRVISAAERVQEVLAIYQEKLKLRKLAELEELLTERFRMLSRKKDMIERIEIDAESFNLRLFAAGRVPVDKDRLSAGEQQILAVSFLWALGIASGRRLPVVIDTPLSRMDSAHRHELVESYFPHASHQVILLSTDTEIDKGYFQQLQDLDVIDRSYLLEFDAAAQTSKIRPGYFWGS